MLKEQATMTNRNPQQTARTQGEQDARRGVKPFPPAPWRSATAQEAAAANLAYMAGYESAVSGLKVSML